MICNPFELVVIPFPFAESAAVKLRPAVVISRPAFNEFGLTTTLMVTSALHSPWPGDIRLDHASAGLPRPSIARLKVFTIDNRLIRAKVGQLTAEDQRKLLRELHRYLAISEQSDQQHGRTSGEAGDP